MAITLLTGPGLDSQKFAVIKRKVSAVERTSSRPVAIECRRNHASPSPRNLIRRHRHQPRSAQRDHRQRHHVVTGQNGKARGQRMNQLGDLLQVAARFLHALILGTSSASRRIVAGSRLAPVRLGML